MKTHKFDAISFFTGLVIATVGLVFLIPGTPSDVIEAVSRLGNWFWPVLLLLLGLAILIPVFLPDRDQETNQTSNRESVGH